MGLAKDTTGSREIKDDAAWEVEFDTKDKTGMVKEIEKKGKYSLKKETPWRDEAKEDFKFALGDQWTAEERNLLKTEGRPCLTFNKIEPLLDLVGGWQRENSMRIRVFPEGGEDRTFSEIGDRILKAIDKWTHLNYKLDHQFDDGLVCGKGWIEMAVSYDEDPIDGDLVFRNDTVYQVLRDPDGKEYDQSDWDYIIKLTKYSKEKLKKLYPDATKTIDKLTKDNTEYLYGTGTEDVMKEGDADNYHLGKSPADISAEGDDAIDSDAPEKYLLKEYWHKKSVEKHFVYDVNEAKLEKFDTDEEAQARRTAILTEYDNKHEEVLREYAQAKKISMAAQMAVGEIAALEGAPQKVEVEVKVVKRSVSEMYYAATTAGELLQEDIKSPLAPDYEGFPLFNFFAKWYVSAEDDVLSVKGITRNVKDANREVNKARSQFLHILNTTANSGWIGDKNALSGQGWKDLKTMGSTPGVVLKKKPGTDLNRIEPAGTNMSNLLRGDKAESDIKEISGINPDAMAMQDKTTSGKAISLRIKQALTILAKYFRNFRYTKEMVGTAVYAMIPQVFDVAAVRKVLGEEFMQKNGIDDGRIMSFLEQIKDGKYDMSITEADNTATVRQETFENLMQMAEAMPGVIPPDVILEFSSMPNAKEIIERIKAFIEQQSAGEQPAK